MTQHSTIISPAAPMLTTSLLAQISDELRTGTLEAEVAARLDVPRELVTVAVRELVRLGVAQTGTASTASSSTGTNQCSSCPAGRQEHALGKIPKLLLPLACSGCPFTQPNPPAQN